MIFLDGLAMQTALYIKMNFQQMEVRFAELGVKILTIQVQCQWLDIGNQANMLKILHLQR